MNDLDVSNRLRDFELKRLILSTERWQQLHLPSSLVWTITQVAKTPASVIPADKKGVYTFVVQPGIAAHPICSILLYVGKAGSKTGFRGRYSTYLDERQVVDTARPLVNRMVKTWFDHLWFCYAEVPDAHITDTEEELLRAYLPPMNTQFPADISPAMRAF